MKRVDLKTGFLCNNNCLFCVQAHKKGFGNRTTAALKADLKKARKTGCSGVVFTGGEPTIRPDLTELISEARELGFERIQLQTNARRLSYLPFCREVIAAGANEFSPALHGHIAELHDYLTRAPGSFDQTVRAIRNLRQLGQYIITNTVVVKPNYRHLPELAGLLVSLKADQFQFAFVHAVGNAYDNYDQLMPWISLASPYIRKGLQIGIDSGLKVMAEGMTPCTLRGYEQYCSEGCIPKTEIRDIVDYDPSYENTRKTQGKLKFTQCRKCRYDTVCEGPWKEYPERRGSKEFVPVK